MCEIVNWKQKYLASAFPGIPIFRDMMTLGSGVGFDVTQNKEIIVPEAKPLQVTLVLYASPRGSESMSGRHPLHRISLHFAQLPESEPPIHCG